MEQIEYERPREKLLRRGVSALTNTELLQIIISSGGSNMPVAKVARRVHEQLSRLDSAARYTSLTKINGIGMVNALRIMASIEIGKRFAQPVSIYDTLDLTKVKSSTRMSAMYTTYSGSGSVITTNFEQLISKESSMLVVRRICAKVLSDNAWGVSVAIGYKSAPKQPGIFELGLLNDLKELTVRLQIKLLSVEYVSGQQIQFLYRAQSA